MDVSALFFAVICAFLLSLNANAFLYYKFRKAKKEPQPTLEAQKLLASIASGSAVLKIHVMEPGDFFLRSPRG